MYSIIPYAGAVLGAVLGYIHLHGLGAYSGHGWRTEAQPSLVLILTTLVGAGLAYGVFSLAAPLPTAAQFGVSGATFIGAIWKRNTTLFYAGNVVLYGWVACIVIGSIIKGIAAASGAASSSSSSSSSGTSSSSSSSKTTSNSSSDDNSDGQNHHFLIQWAYEDDEDDD